MSEPNKPKPPEVSALPCVFLDANNASYIFEMQNRLGKKAYQPKHVLDTLCKEGNSTIIIPRSVFNEITSWSENSRDDGKLTVVSGYLDLYRKDDGSIDVCLDDSTLRHPNTQGFVDWLKDKQAAGQLRVATSLKELYDDKQELTAAKGGVVIADTGMVGLREIDGQGVIAVKKEIRYFNKKKRNETQRFLPEAKSGFGKGDPELRGVGRTIAAYCNTNQRTPTFMVLTDDVGCQEQIAAAADRYDDRPEAQPIQPKLLQLMTALKNSGHMPHRAFSSMSHMLSQELLANGEPDPGIVKRLARNPSFKAGVASCQQWIQDCGLGVGPHLDTSKARGG